MKHPYAIILAVLLAFTATTADAITRQKLINYASSLKGLKKAELKTAMYKIMQPSKVLNYGSGKGKTWSGFVKTDRIGNTLECRNRYSTDRFYFSSTTQTSAIEGMNIEHSFPKSWWGGSKNNAYQDLYNLYPSESSSNSSKGNYVMDEVSDPSKLDDYEKVGTGANAASYATSDSKYAVEPADTWKGDFCRSYFYMVTTYQNFSWTSSGLSCLQSNTYPTLQKWAYTLYLKWASKDPVDTIEVNRNDAVYSIQGNRNLFIDFPYLAEYVWGDSTDVAFDPTTSITTASDDNRYGTYTPSPDDPNVNPNPSYDGWIFAKITGQPTAGKRYLIVVNNSGSLLAMKTISKNYGYPNGETVTATDDKITMQSEDDAFTLETSGTGFLLKGNDGKYYYNDKSHKNFDANTSKPSNNVWTVTSRGDGTYTISNGSNFIQYSTSFKSFGAYTTAQSGGLYPYLYEEQDKTTGIDAIQTSKPKTADNAVYTIQGVRVNSDGQLPPGIYIKAGKKFIVR